MGDVPFVPESHILKRNQCVAAHNPGQARNIFAPDRVPLVGHGGAAFLALAERLGGLSYLGSLKMANLGCHFVKGRADNRQSAEVLGMPVTLQGLSGHAGKADSQALADCLLQLRRQVRKGPDRTADLAHLQHLPGPAEAIQVPFHLRVPHRKLQPQGDGLGVNAVGSPHHDRLTVSLCLLLQSLRQLQKGPFNQPGSFAHLQGLSRVHHIGGGEAQMNKSRLRSQCLGYGRREGHDIMVSQRFDLPDALHRKGSIVADPGGGLSRNLTPFGQNIADSDLDLQPLAKAVLVRPHPGHVRMGVSRDHRWITLEGWV